MTITNNSFKNKFGDGTSCSEMAICLDWLKFSSPMRKACKDTEYCLLSTVNAFHNLMVRLIEIFHMTESIQLDFIYIKTKLHNEGRCDNCTIWRLATGEVWGQEYMESLATELLNIGSWTPRGGPVLSDHLFPHVAQGFRARNLPISTFHALLGTQLVVTLVMVSIIQKLGPHYSLARWLLCSTGLIRFLHPTNDELKALALIPKEKKSNKKDRRNHENGRTQTYETFHVPRSLDIQLETAKVSALDVVHLRFYAEYQWLVDFSIYALCVYIITEIYTAFVPLKDEVNLSILWCMLVVAFTFKILLSLTVQYFKGSESVGERSTVIVTAFAYLVVAMMVLIVDERNLETGLETAYSSFNESASVFLENHGLDSQGPASKLVLKFFLALWCALVGALFTFPGLRMARMHWDSLKYCSDQRLLKLALNISFASPFLLTLLWVRPVSRDYLTVRVWPGGGAGGGRPLMTSSAFDTLRVWLVVAAVVQRVAVMPPYLQAYLNLAYQRLQLQKKEAGRITNVELQRKIAGVFHYLCVVALQYMAPLLLCLYFTLIYKTLGEYTWSGLFFDPPPAPECPANATPSAPPPLPLADGDSVLGSAQQFTLTLDSLKQVFTQEVYRGLFGFATWWTCFVWFTSSALGMVYQSYFAHV